LIGHCDDEKEEWIQLYKEIDRIVAQNNYLGDPHSISFVPLHETVFVDTRGRLVDPWQKRAIKLYHYPND
jgi:hypothetical protein